MKQRSATRFALAGEGWPLRITSRLNGCGLRQYDEGDDGILPAGPSTSVGLRRGTGHGPLKRPGRCRSRAPESPPPVPGIHMELWHPAGVVCVQRWPRARASQTSYCLSMNLSIQSMDRIQGEHTRLRRTKIATAGVASQGGGGINITIKINK